MSGLGLDTSEFVAPKSSFGLSTAFSEFEKRLVNSIKAAVKKIVEEGRLAEMKSLIKVKAEIEALHQNITVLPDDCSDLILKKHLRFLILVIDNRLSEYKFSKKEIRAIRKTFLSISKKIGVVPRLNACVQQPDAKYLPINYESTIEKWAKLQWTPDDEEGGERPSFFSKKDERSTVSVRRHLLALDRDGATGKALSYADADFYIPGDLDADHLQPGEKILDRQLELLEAMKIDPIFAKEMIAADSRGYFIKIKGVFYGSKLFFMDYYNCIDNLWLINPSMNKGNKGRQDPIDWLKRQVKYHGFFKAIGGEASIVKSAILYVTADGRVLCKALKEWFRAFYAQDIVASGYMLNSVKEPALALVSEAKKIDTPKARIKAMSSYAAMSILAKGSPPKAPIKKRKSNASKGHLSKKGRVVKKSLISELCDCESDDELLGKLSSAQSDMNKENMKEMEAVYNTSPVRKVKQKMVRLANHLYAKKMLALSVPLVSTPKPKASAGSSKRVTALKPGSLR